MFLKLLHLLLETESDAAIEAKRRGFKPRGFGYWEKDGKVVARTRNNKLELIDPDNPNTSFLNTVVPDAKPTTMSAKQAGTSPSNDVRPQDVAKSNGDLAKEKESGKDGGDNTDVEQQGPPTIPPNPYRTNIEVGKPIEKSELRDLLGDDHPWKDVLEEIVIGEQITLINSKEFTDFMYMKDGSRKELKASEVHKMNKEDAIKQHSEWRNSLDIETRKKLLETQTWWRIDAQWGRHEEDRKKRNQFINEIAKGPPPAEVNTVLPLERGMKIRPENIKSFLNNFRIGEDVDLPPSGFSGDGQVAREFANPGGETVGVLLRLIPNQNGKINGIRLHDVSPSDYKGSPQHIAMLHKTKPYEAELEVIRPSGPKARCVNVKKLIKDIDDPKWTRVIYVIDLEEQGYPESSITEDFDAGENETLDPVFEKIMNTSFGYWRPKKKNVTENSHWRKNVKLFDLLMESKASELAHKLGLEYEGYGYWSKNGVIVAKTVKDQLIKVTPKEKNVFGYQYALKGTNKEFAKDNPYNNLEIDPDDELYTGDDFPVSEDTTKGDAENILHTKYGDGSGTNDGGFYIGKDGIKRYVKFYKEPVKAYGEVLANSIYRDLGIAAPKSQYFENPLGKVYGDVGFASEIVENEGELKDVGISEETAKQILDGFAADCLVANWDVVGAANEGYLRNAVIAKDGTPVRIDQGGAFLTRGLMGMKPEDALYKLGEWEIFPSNNPGYQEVFKAAGYKKAEDIGYDNLKKQVTNILNLHNKSGGWKKYVDEKIPDADPKDKEKIVKMLYIRTKLLISKIKNWQNN